MLAAHHVEKVAEKVVEKAAGSALHAVARVLHHHAASMTTGTATTIEIEIETGVIVVTGIDLAAQTIATVR